MSFPLTALKKNFRSKFLPVLLSTALLSVPLLPASRVEASETELLSNPWNFTGNNGAAEKYQNISSSSLTGKDTLQLTYNLHGLCLVGGDASAIIFDQPVGQTWRYISLSNYGKNCADGAQTVSIPLSQFTGLDTAQPVGTFHARIWHGSSFNVDITSAKLLGSQQSTQPVLAPSPTPTPAPAPSTQTTGGYTGQYWNVSQTSSSNTQIPTSVPTLTRTDSAINFNWGQNSPAAGVNSDRFITRWIGQKSFTAGNYRFTTVSDDGIRLWVDSKLIIDKWNDHPETTHTADISLTEGTHKIQVDYYENAGGAVAKMSFAPVSAAAPAPTPTSSPVVTSGGSWAIQSVSSMKQSKDKICGQDSQAFINTWVDKAKELGVTHVAVETPYDNPACGNAVAYGKLWADIIHSKGLKVWHRHMPLAFESIYDTPKVQSDFFNMITSYIKNNSSQFQPGDIFTPIPEPQNGGIGGVTGCGGGVCQFNNPAHFNQWLRNAIDTSESAFQSIGLGGQMKLGYYGFDGFVAWGSNNPDWNGILEDATVQKMGNLTVDHYPELIGQTMEQGLNELQARYPNTPIIIGEWGSAGTTNLEQQVINSMGAAKRPGVVGFNYWHMGMGGNEALINGDFTNRIQFDEVQSFFKGLR